METSDLCTASYSVSDQLPVLTRMQRALVLLHLQPGTCITVGNSPSATSSPWVDQSAVPRPTCWAGMLPPPLTNHPWLSAQLGDKLRDTGSPHMGAPMGCTAHRVEMRVEVQPGPRGPSVGPSIAISGHSGPPRRAENGTDLSSHRLTCCHLMALPAQRDWLLCCCHGSLACPG